MNSLKKICLPSLTALSLALSAGLAHADERASLEALRLTTQALIDALVDKGVLTREVADSMLKQAQQRASTAAADSASAKPETSAAGKPVQRVPYVSEATKAQIRNEVKEEILTQARAENWGTPNAVPSWVSRLKIEGDIRYRHQMDTPDGDNTPATTYANVVKDGSTGLIRALDLATYDGNGVVQSSTNDKRSRERLRLRLALTAKVSDEVGVGVRLATGNAIDRVSTNQTLGQDFNKYQLFVDRAFVRLTPLEGVDLTLGRVPNPWFSTDMVWSENLNFEGAAATARLINPDATFEPFATVGAFPIRDNAPPSRSDRWLYGAQVGTLWKASSRTQVKLGLAYYHYQNIAGQEDQDWSVTTSNVFVPGASYGQYAYKSGLVQRGNTLFETNPLLPGVSGIPLQYGLAYQFKPLVLTASAEFQHFSPYSLLGTFEYVRNTAFSQKDFARRAGSSFTGIEAGGDPNGYHLKLGLGKAEVREEGDWQASVGYKHVGSDSVLDAFTDSDLGLGGTNIKGYTLGFQYGLYRQTSIGARYLSGKTIDSPINDAVDAKFGVSTLQVDLNVRF